MADQKITVLPENTTPVLTDILPMVDDPAGTPATQKISLDTLATLFTNNSLARQAVMNGNFDVWQRGTSFTNPGNNSYTTDRWCVDIGNSGTLPTTIIHSRQLLTSGDIPNAFYFYRIAPNGAGSGFGVNDYYIVEQRIEHGVRLLCGAGKKITVSFWARSSISNKKIGCYIAQSYGTGGSPSGFEAIAGDKFTLTSSWQKLTITITTNTLVSKTFGTNNDDILYLFFATEWGTTLGANVNSSGVAETFVGAGNIDIAQVQLNAGDVALPFMPKSFDDELSACQRYFEKSYDYATAIAAGSVANDATIQNSGATGATNARTIIPTAFKVKKRIAVTPVLYDYLGAINKVSYYDATGNLTNGSTADGIFVGENIFSVYKTLTGISGLFYHWTADAEL